MSYAESTFATDFGKYIRENRERLKLDHSFAVERKVKRVGARLNLISDFQPQQIPGLLSVKNGCDLKTLSNLDPSLKKYDAYQLCYTPAYVAVCWYKPRYYKHVYMIDAEKLANKIKLCDKSIDEEDAKELASFYFEL